VRLMGCECRVWEGEENYNKRIKDVIIMTKEMIVKLWMIILRNCFILNILKYFYYNSRTDRKMAPDLQETNRNVLRSQLLVIVKAFRPNKLSEPQYCRTVLCDELTN